MFFRRRDQVVVALEIGTAKVVAAAGQVHADGHLTLLGTVESSSAGVRKGDITDIGMADRTVRDVLASAEEKFDMVIEDVFMAVSGAHLECVLQHGTTQITGPDSRVTPGHLEEVQRASEEVVLSHERCHVATLPKHFRLDGGELVPDPIGMVGHRLEGEYLVVHGISGRLRNLMGRVTDQKIEVRDFTLSPIASAEAVLTEEQRMSGALVLDLGAGLTHYAVYQGGQLEWLGVIGVGGDHVTNDISRAFNLPNSHSEELKCQFGSVLSPRERGSNIIQLKPRSGFAGKNLYQESLVEVMRDRWEEILLIVREHVGSDLLKLLSGGVMLTGGGAKTRGLPELATHVLGLPAQVVNTHDMAGNMEELARPELSSVLGVLKHAHQRVVREEQERTIARRLSHVFEKVRLMI
jgi:cell division protein FtsA